MVSSTVAPYVTYRTAAGIVTTSPPRYHASWVNGSGGASTVPARKDPSVASAHVVTNRSRRVSGARFANSTAELVRKTDTIITSQKTTIATKMATDGIADTERGRMDVRFGAAV